MNKITDFHDTNLDTLDNGTDGELDQVIGSDCGGTLRIRGDFKEEGGPLTNISILVFFNTLQTNIMSIT